jgi:hypothetical protein
MEVNRHNYETYFLLWVDGELSAKEQNDVEQFIDKNPDLAIELVLLQDAKLPMDDTLIYENKESLLKVESPALSLSTYEDYFLLYIDNELSSQEKQEVELFVLQHPALQAEFLLLQKTILTKERFVFTNKELLYKKEEDKKPVIFLNWRLIAIAAAVIGLIFSIWMIVPNNSIKQSNQQLVSVKNATISSATKAEPLVSKEKVNGKQVDSNTKLNIANRNGNKIGVQNEIEYISNDILASKEKTIPIVNTQQELINNNSVAESVNNSTSIIDATEKSKIIAASIINESDQPSIIKQAVYRELDTDEFSSSLYVGSLEINKDKLRGFLRKAGTIFRSKSKQIEVKTDTNK